MEKYQDIINLSRPLSKYPHMSLYQRSAQFAPFAALTGYERLVKETARLTNERIELSEELKVILDIKLRIIQNKLSDKPEIKIIYFIPDLKKVGGEYKTIINKVKKIDNYTGQIIMQNGLKININEIIDIQGEIFKEINEIE